MKRKLRLAKDLCPAGGDTIPATAEDATFKLVRCPTCGRQNLRGENPQADPEHGYVVTLPAHRARASFGQPAQAVEGETG